MRIEEIDPNFQEKRIGDRPVVYLDVMKGPFAVEGQPWPAPAGQPWRVARIPPYLTKDEVNEGALDEGWHMTTGAAIRFRSDSPFVAIKAILSHSCDMNHMTRTGSAGFDIYATVDGRWLHAGSAQPNRDEVDLERMLFIRDVEDTGMKDFLVNLPLYGGVDAISIGLAPGAVVEAPLPHRNGKILFYGSSVTQGACASHPGAMHPSLLCRKLDAEQINMGFSGCARGELAMAKVIAGMKDLTAFFYHYDANAPTLEHLQRTHEPFFRVIREAQPKLPIVITGICDYLNGLCPARERDYYVPRRNVLLRTYRNAIAAGDRHVYYIDSSTLFGDVDPTECSTEKCHPNDLGFYRMYETILPVLSRAIEEREP